MKLYGYTVISSPAMIERIFTKKQTRKFKNNRWCKKYQKKYSCFLPRKTLLVDSMNKMIWCHPETYRLLKEEKENWEAPQFTHAWVDEYMDMEERKAELLTSGFDKDLFRSLYMNTPLKEL